MLVPYKIGRGYFAGKRRMTYRRMTKLWLTYGRHFEISALFSQTIRNNNQMSGAQKKSQTVDSISVHEHNEVEKLNFSHLDCCAN